MVNEKIVSPGASALGISWLYPPSGEQSLQKNARWKDQVKDVGYINLHFSAVYAMGCCGAGTLTGLSGTVKEKDREKIALVFHQKLGILSPCVTYYAIASTSQLVETKTNSESLLSFMMELGLKEVFKSPNRNHGPNDMHLMVWDPVEAQKSGAFDKYVWVTESGYILPLSMKSMTKEERAKIFAEWEILNKKDAEETTKRIQREKEEVMASKLSVVSSLLRARTVTPNPKLDELLRNFGYEYSKSSGITQSYESSIPAPSTIGFAQNPIGQAQGVLSNRAQWPFPGQIGQHRVWPR